ncbi:2-succinyl-5-enolpyruvyl-6-hydroxy-3-cyclohexene-1-carboxylic-acid synthase [Natronobiforma cellulositropha]|uniref:2-succinyl-5-enolpyruvyl-6-hydroxy-3- cyclohexene-1-carboxylic-acid synthase n=1 Tax=Natronobiforma cellulositropha TaxID=1679076 RepID=UPI0021D57AFC|nr:2-succinyl-5-enolpyruvyl-6-hydroxy-3-cyclohexene-1-carboxylic-acid synthase [Natronobiforma cellulositropha]
MAEPPAVPNRNTLWGTVLAAELAAGGLESVCIAPGSRSTPLTVAFDAHPDVTVFSHLDERSAAYFALGRARRTGEPTALVCTSGTAVANFHPAVIEADEARVPLLVLSADRPAELRDSGANQTVDQVDLFGSSVRWHADLPLPEPDERTLRMVRTAAARALAAARGSTGAPGPVHLNCPFRKPLEPVPVPGDVPDDLLETLAGRGRDGPFVETRLGRRRLEETAVSAVANALADADRPLLVAGPATPGCVDAVTLTALANTLAAPLLADPLSGLRFGPHLTDASIFGGYDAYLEGEAFEPDVVLRVGAAPTSARLIEHLRDADCEQVLVDPAGGWREATFTATDLVVADPSALADALVAELEGRTTGSEAGWLERFERAEAHHWSVLEAARTDERLANDPFEGAMLASVLAEAPDPAAVFVSNSMPIRDADRFGEPREAALTVLANRGASGIDGVVSTALGAGSASADPLVFVTGDLAFYHDSNGLLALERCGVDATVVLLDNDGGGIFHMLPIEDYDPPFTGQFKTPHGLDFGAFEDLYDLTFERVTPETFDDAYRRSLESTGTQVLHVEFDAAASHRRREELETESRRWHSA